MLRGRDGADTLDGGAGFDTLDGGAGNDILIGGIGARGDEDWFEGSTGNDTIHGGLEGQNDDPNQNHWNEINYYERGISGIEATFSTSRSGTVKSSAMQASAHSPASIPCAGRRMPINSSAVPECNVSSGMQVRTSSTEPQVSTRSIIGPMQGLSAARAD